MNSEMLCNTYINSDIILHNVMKFNIIIKIIYPTLYLLFFYASSTILFYF